MTNPTRWHEYADEIHIMAYDYMGSFNPTGNNEVGP
jgi:GH18 family chitinase